MTEQSVSATQPRESASESEHQTGYLLQQLEVFNWGPFHGFHRAEFDGWGTAVIGPTGSGKTTLIDALMTLLVATPRYNLASTGGHESDRTLISYVRGVLGGDGSDGKEQVARPGRTVTGLCATYSNGHNQLRLAGLMWAEGTSNAPGDLKRRWIFSQADDQQLQDWLRQLNDDGIRELMKRGRNTAGLRIFESKKAYLAHTRRFFDVGDNAFTLLNRAAGLKQLNSIDEIFRELVLDERSAFDRALEVAAEFDNLADIREELERARRQRDSLIPVSKSWQKLLKSKQKADALLAISQMVPTWFAVVGAKLWEQQQTQLQSEIRSLRQEQERLQAEEAAGRKRTETLNQQYLALGGQIIRELENTIQAYQKEVRERTQFADDYQRLAATFQLEEHISKAALQKNQEILKELLPGLQKQRDKAQDEALQAMSRKRELTEQRIETKEALDKVRNRPGSNIPPRSQDFRADLAEQLGLPEADLPFLAELVEVKAEFSDWRGAIERAIGAERLRILVPDDVLKDALRWINQRDNRLHVRLQKARPDDKARRFFDDGYANKLNLKDHRLAATARRMLAAKDLHCVDHPDKLRQTEFGLTIEGLISGPKGRFEKQDRSPLHSGWMTGFDNKDQLQAMEDRMAFLKTQEAEWQRASDTHRQRLDGFDQQLDAARQLLEVDFSRIDLPGAEAQLKQSEERLKALLDPDSDASAAKQEFDRQKKQLQIIQEQLRSLETRIAVLQDRCERCDEQQQKAAERAGEGLSEQQYDDVFRWLAIKEEPDVSTLDSAERRARDRAEAEHLDLRTRVADAEKSVVRNMEVARRVDTGALTDAGSDVEDIEEYLERLRVLTDEALPEKLGRFLEYLNQSSDQGVTQLLAGITEEVSLIENRIEELNQTLVKVDFRSGRYLQLEPNRIRHERIRELESAIRHLRSAVMKDDDGESHYRALSDVIEILRTAAENRRQQGARSLLDPRYRLQFFVVEVNRQTGDRSPRRTGSQSGSGGEKELMASHILTASLSYALCPQHASRPLYGTVVLDEAFSKSSPSAANRIIEALRIFHLHPIFVTPNKEIGLLKKHTRKVICVQRPKREASLACISWERLEQLAPPS